MEIFKVYAKKKGGPTNYFPGRVASRCRNKHNVKAWNPRAKKAHPPFSLVPAYSLPNNSQLPCQKFGQKWTLIYGSWRARVDLCPGRTKVPRASRSLPLLFFSTSLVPSPALPMALARKTSILNSAVINLQQPEIFFPGLRFYVLVAPVIYFG